jgi:general secretion pathway protein L
MIREFLTWWGGQLADCVPEKWRRFGPSGDDALVITPIGPISAAPEAILVRLRSNGRENPIGRYALARGDLLQIPRSAGKAVALRLTEADVLSKTVTLPLAAERDLGQVLAFEIDRETPFNAEEIFWTHRVIRRDRQRGQLSARLLLVQRERLSALLDTLGRAGIVPKRVEIADGPDRGSSLPLDSGDGLPRTSAGRNLQRWPAAVLCAGLLIAAVVTPFVRDAWTASTLDRQIASGRSAATEAEKLRREIERLSGTAELIDSERDKAGRPLAVLAALTRMLPADTYLTELRQQQRKVTVSGRSAAASRLIGALSADDQLRNPSFAAPVTRIEALRAEVFTITVEVAP